MHLVWWQWVLVALGVYVLGYFLVTVYNRAKDINSNKESSDETYINGLLWPLAVLLIPMGLLELSAQGYAKYLGYRDRRIRNKKFGNVA